MFTSGESAEFDYQEPLLPLVPMRNVDDRTLGFAVLALLNGMAEHQYQQAAAAQDEIGSFYEEYAPNHVVLAAMVMDQDRVVRRTMQAHDSRQVLMRHTIQAICGDQLVLGAYAQFARDQTTPSLQ